MMRNAAIMLLLTLPLAACGSREEPDAPRTATVTLLDNVFQPMILRVEPGATVVWKNEGRSIHNVVSDDLSWYSKHLQRGDSFQHRFDKSGRYQYYCGPHGDRPLKGMSGVILVGAGFSAQDAETVRHHAAAYQPPTVPHGSGRRWNVPTDSPTIQSAVDQAKPGDMVLIAEGVYHEAVSVITSDLTIRGVDRNNVILDGNFELDNGIKALGVRNIVFENMTARNYLLNGFYWYSVDGYRGSYLTAYNNGDYGLYAFDSTYGQMEYSYASGHPDSGFYIGQCYPCNALITDVVSENNALGFSGTNAGGNLTIRDSLWQHNLGGIVPNTLDSELMAPQRAVRIVNNKVLNNNNRNAPFKPLQYPALGTGIFVSGGNGNVIESNLVENHINFGILIGPMLDKNLWRSNGNVVRANKVRNSGRADVALMAPSGGGNCFSGNDTTRFSAAAWLFPCGSIFAQAGVGDLLPAVQELPLFLSANKAKSSDWKKQAISEAQTSMPDQPPLAPWPPAQPTTRAVTVPEPAPFSFAVFLGLCLYVLPLLGFATWIVVAIRDAMRKDNRRAGWALLILVVPVLGAFLYFVLGKPRVSTRFRATLVLLAPVWYVIAALSL